MRIILMIFLSSIVLGCIYLAALIKHAKASDLRIFSAENMVGTLPLFAVVVGVAVLVVIALMKESSKSSKKSKEDVPKNKQ